MTTKSDRIERLLKDEDLREAFDNVKAALLSAFTNCKTDDVERMADISKRLHLLDAVEKNLRSAIKDGQLEEFRTTEQERPSFLGDISKWRTKNRA